MNALTRTATALLLSATLTTHALAGGPPPRGPDRHGPSARHDGDWLVPLLFLGIAGAMIASAVADEKPRPAYAPAYPQPYGYAQGSGYAQAPGYPAAPAYAPPAGYPVPPTTYAAPPAAYAAPPALPADAGYWCGSAGMHYPATRYCPEGWQLVPRQ